MLNRLRAPPRPAAAVPDSPLGARSVFTVGQRWALFAAFTLLVALRLPDAWTHGRFQDEEATVFLAYAWHHPWLDALFRPFAGYWNLGANASTVLVAELVKGGVVSLERAPYITMTIGLAFQVLPGVLILTGKAQWLANRLAVVVALLMIAIMPATSEVSFNVLHIQFHLALCTGIILALDVPDSRLARASYQLLLFLAPLCGPGAIVLLPFFALRAFLDRDTGRAWQFGVLAVGAALQLLIFYGPSPVRGHPLNPALIPAVMLVRMIALPAVGIQLGNRVAMTIVDSLLEGGVLVWLASAATVALFAALVWKAAQRRDAAVWLVLSGLSISAVTFGVGMATLNPLSAFNIQGGERYNFLPLVLVGLALLVLAMRTEFRRSIFAALCLLMLITGAYHYQLPLEDFAHGPSWPDEVRAWRADHNHPLAVWPRPWVADLSDEAQECLPPGPDPAHSTQPRYCESGWLAGFYRM
ncbi:hypothetical protein [Sphingomonas daechungensis]|uniref:hypothetical protein n=1 Tax=Sphingomonas daechungensis TaxID=1176646 RepID=UPI0031F19FCC